MRLQKITATEVVVPARKGSVHSISPERSLHNLGAKVRALRAPLDDVAFVPTGGCGFPEDELIAGLDRGAALSALV